MKHKSIQLDPLSGASLYLQLLNRGNSIGTATGFIVQHQKKYFLVTNWHVVTGRCPATNKMIFNDSPDEMVIVHHSSQIGMWNSKSEPLYHEDGSKRWREHPLGQRIDVVAIPLSQYDSSVSLCPLDLQLAHTDMIPEVAMPVSIIGFPLGLTGPGVFPIWKTGHIASEPLLDYRSEPVFLIDATTRGGMSGSPVVLRLNGGFRQKSGDYTIGVVGYMTRFLGIYSGRIHRESEIGKVWKPHVISKIL